LGQIRVVEEGCIVTDIQGDAGFANPGYIADDTDLADPQAVTSHQHLFPAFAAGGLEQGVLTAWVNQENAYVEVAERFADFIRNLGQENLQVL